MATTKNEDHDQLMKSGKSTLANTIIVFRSKCTQLRAELAAKDERIMDLEGDVEERNNRIAMLTVERDAALAVMK